eukprot:4642075-Amphidinium_carterae.1
MSQKQESIAPKWEAAEVHKPGSMCVQRRRVQAEQPLLGARNIQSTKRVLELLKDIWHSLPSSYIWSEAAGGHRGRKRWPMKAASCKQKRMSTLAGVMGQQRLENFG